MAGLDESFQGEAWLAKGYTVGYLPQEPVLDDSLDVLGNVKLGVASTQALLDEFEALSMKLGEPMDDDEMMKVLDRQAAVQDKIDAVNAWELDSQLEVAMDALRLPPADSEVTHLSGGEKRRVALCRLLLEKPDLLLLDEPTAGLDPVASLEIRSLIEASLNKTGATCVWATHELHAVPSMATRALLLAEGRIVFDGTTARGLSREWLVRAGLSLPEGDSD